MNRALVTLVASVVVGSTVSWATVITPGPASVTASSEYNSSYAVGYLFDATTVAESNIGTTSYGNPDGQYAGSGGGPHNVFMDFGSSVTADGFVYSQRVGSNPSVDKVTSIEFWFEASNPGTTLPVRVADSSVTITNTTDSLLTQYWLGNTYSQQYVAMRLTGNGGNPGGSEFRLSNGPPTPPPTYINQEIPLTVDMPNTTDPGFGATEAGLVNDLFAYNPDDPTATSPAQGWTPTSQIFITPNNSGGIVDLDFDGLYDNILLDIWGRDDYAGAEESRHQNLTLTFYNGLTQTHQIIGWSGVSAKGDDPASFGRYTVPVGVLADRVTIARAGDYFLLAEVRAATANAAVPEPSTLAISTIGLICLAAFARRRRRS